MKVNAQAEFSLDLTLSRRLDFEEFQDQVWFTIHEWEAPDRELSDDNGAAARARFTLLDVNKCASFKIPLVDVLLQMYSELLLLSLMDNGSAAARAHFDLLDANKCAQIVKQVCQSHQHVYAALSSVGGAAAHAIQHAGTPTRMPLLSGTSPCCPACFQPLNVNEAGLPQGHTWKGTTRTQDSGRCQGHG